MWLPPVIVLAAALAEDVVLPEGKAKKLIEETCSECHGLDQIANASLSTAQWRRTVNTMVKRGAALSPEQIDSVVDYLSVYFAAEKINVNKASAADLEGALGITAAEAAAIVEYRKANGDFQDIDGLRKVPALDAKKIEAKKDQLAF